MKAAKRGKAGVGAGRVGEGHRGVAWGCCAGGGYLRYARYGGDRRVMFS